MAHGPGRGEGAKMDEPPTLYQLCPAGEMLAPHWRAIMAAPDGYKIVCCALMMRDLAVISNACGLICHPSGQPMSLAEIAACIGVEAIWLGPVLQLLEKIGYFRCDGGGIICTDPVIASHFARLERSAAPMDRPRELILDAARRMRSPAARAKRLARNRQRRAEYKKKWGREPEEITLREVSVIPGVIPALAEREAPTLTLQPQVPEITDENRALAYSTKTIQQIAKKQLLHAADAAAFDFDLLAQLPPECRQIVNKFKDLPESAIAAAIEKVIAKKSKITNHSAYLHALLAAPDAVYQSPSPDPSVDEEQQAEAWEWWSGLAPAERGRIEAENHSRLLGIPRLTDRRKALILFRLHTKQQAAA